MTLRTRFAPSPTGYLHIGGVRTALFNWLLTQRHGGQFVLRIDDTDAQRNRTEALQPILDGFRWLGINWDEGPEVGGPYAPYFQSQRDHLYSAAAQKLLAAGTCLSVLSHQGAIGRGAQGRPKSPRSRTFIAASTATRLPNAASNFIDRSRQPLRLRSRRAQRVVLQDLIRGKVEWQTDLLGDPVILRPDGRALYNFATVVDDAAMKITHVVRAARASLEHSHSAAGLPGLGSAVAAIRPCAGGERAQFEEEAQQARHEEVRHARNSPKLHAIGWTDEQIDSRDDLNPATVAFYRELGYSASRASSTTWAGSAGRSTTRAKSSPCDEMIAELRPGARQ